MRAMATSAMACTTMTWHEGYGAGHAPAHHLIEIKMDISSKLVDAAWTEVAHCKAHLATCEKVLEQMFPEPAELARQALLDMPVRHAVPCIHVRSDDSQGRLP